MLLLSSADFFQNCFFQKIISGPQSECQLVLIKIWIQTVCKPYPGLHRLEKYLNLEGFLENSLEIKSALKSTGKLLKSLEKSSNFCFP